MTATATEAARYENRTRPTGPTLQHWGLGRRFSKAHLFWTLHGTGWGAFGATMLYWGLSHWTVTEAIVNKALLVASGFALTLGFRWIYRRVRARRVSPLGLAPLVAALSFGGAVVWFELYSIPFLAWYAGMRGVDVEIGWIEIPIGTLLYNGFVLLAWSLLYLGANAFLDLEAERVRANRAEALAHQARLQALQSQLEPHFLFNTLNAISTLVAEGRNPDASRMIARLSDFLRLTLDTADRCEIAVAEELEFVRRYLEIEQVRFGDRLRVAIDASPEAMRGLVPVLLLQPLVENALKHGVMPREDGGSVNISIGRERGVLRISIADDGPGLGGEPVNGKGVGLANTEARIAELYGDRSRFVLGESPGGGSMATVEIPYRRAPVPNARSEVLRGNAP